MTAVSAIVAEQRRHRPAGHLPAVAVAGDVDLAVLRAAGWRVTGRLSPTPYDDPRDAPSYTGVEELLVDARVDGVALDGRDPRLSRHLPALREAGLLVLLPTPAPLDTDLLGAARAVDTHAEVAVGLVERFAPWARTAAAALPLVGTPVLQATVRGWPAGEAPAAELVDLVRGWCGDVVSATAAPGALPAPVLPAGEVVSWALLCAGGATVLVSHEGPLRVHLSCATARLEVGPDGARWTGGADLPLLDGPSGLLAPAAALVAAVGGGEVDAAHWPWPADLGDLLACATTLRALRDSADTGRAVRLA